MDNQRLVAMVNQIAEFFESSPPEEAVRETTSHLRLFWDPRMRTQIRAYLVESGAGLTPTARAAVELLPA